MIESEFLRNWLVVVDKASRKSARTPLALSGLERPAASSKALTRLQCYRNAVRDFEVYGAEDEFVVARVPDAVDPGDRHVAAAAIALLNYANKSGSVERACLLDALALHGAKETVLHLATIWKVAPSSTG
ncbi:hypothetical protein [Rugamonas sp. DEMB1]|uniref:hypothetical protein n=1 Tax=Rugamonas sp. DEMB1 TaxID=3039386 RepID=UPI002449D2F4|nr:hypothetical protein [Rugamonas sp. DEMB1]WGG48396.1 hypothetical protein QC826_16955 [Rugamonas sp. DEMB1]